jgi:hypothetical protein
VIDREYIDLLTLTLYFSGERSSARAPSTKPLVVTDSYSKCNAKSARTGPSSAESTDNKRTSFLFLTPAYISLHGNALAPAKFRRNHRSEEGGREGRSNLRENLKVFDQNLAIFGKWMGVGPTFNLNRDKYTSYGNWTAQKPFISFDFLSPRGGRMDVRARWVGQPCRLTRIDTAFTSPLFLVTLHFAARLDGQIGSFRRNRAVLKRFDPSQDRNCREIRRNRGVLTKKWGKETR